MFKLEAARKSLGTEPIKMTDEGLTYAKEAKRKHGANVVEQEFAQPKHHKDPPSNNKKTNQSAQPASKEQVAGSHPLSLQPPCERKTFLLKKGINQPTETKVKKPHPLQHQWKIRRHNITIRSMT